MNAEVTQTDSKKPQCDMRRNCTNAVTHIGSKGYIYCREHAVERRQYGVERTRQMRAWELRLIESGQPLPSYEPTKKTR